MYWLSTILTPMGCLKLIRDTALCSWDNPRIHHLCKGITKRLLKLVLFVYT